MADVRPYSPDDTELLLDFARSVPAEDRNFLKEDVTDPDVVASWAEPSEVMRFVVVDDTDIVGYVALHPLEGWSHHVAELRVLVAPGARDQGLGQRLVQRALAQALEVDLGKVVVEVISDHNATLGMLEANGFTPEALLVDHVRDRAGSLRDLLMLSCRPGDLLGDMTLTGIEVDSLA